MTAPTCIDAAWEPEALELPLETPRRPATLLPYWHPDDEEQRSVRPSPESSGERSGERGSHVIVIDMA